jgi:hypothetical protein
MVRRSQARAGPPPPPRRHPLPRRRGPAGIAQRARRIEQLALVEPHDQRIRHLTDQLRIVGGDHHGRSQPVQRLEQADQLERHVRIDVAGRFVGDEQFGPADHRAGNRHALLLPAGKRGGLGVAPVGQAHPVQHVVHRADDVLLHHARHAQRQRHVVEGGKVRHQPEILEHHPQPAAEAGQPVARQSDRIGAEHADQPARGALGQIEQRSRLVLPAPLAPVSRNCRKKREADIGQHFLAGAVAQPDIVELNDLGVWLGHDETGVPGLL